uniref:Uncharacterized protein n=1 Tax=Leersia perrieri TaxID=77586 RepID=A0A0D9WEZ8_9ORYZ
MEEVSELGHLLVFGFVYFLGIFMVAPAMTDVTMEALCPGRDECSLAIYLTGLQQAFPFSPPAFGEMRDIHRPVVYMVMEKA